MKSGLLIVNKEKGFTSFDVVAKLRGILHERKIGHTGTLDPNATGVLPILIGKGTKALPLLEDHNKAYVTDFVLGKTTDTYDGDGRVVSTSDKIVSPASVEEAILSFLGKQQQIPPMYSAKKVGGKRLYELARQGMEVEREPAWIEIYGLRILSMELPRVRMEVSCSSGTYIRSLVYDIGERLGTGAYMEELMRTSCCGHSIEESYTLGELQELANQGRIGEALLPLEQVFSYPSYRAISAVDKVIQNGGSLAVSDVEGLGSKEGDVSGRIRLFLSDGRFAGLYKVSGQRVELVKLFLEE